MFVAIHVSGAEISSKNYLFRNFDSVKLNKTNSPSSFEAANYYNNLMLVTSQSIDDINTTRGSTEINVYQKASQGTILIVTDDALGSGALITSKGHILTNHHVVGKNDTVTVFFKTKSSEKIDLKKGIIATVIKVDELADLALIKIDDSKAPKSARPIVLAKKTPPVGSDAHAIGHPAGQLWTYTKGYISQIRDDFSWIDHKANVIQVQTPINPGNSGGPLLDSRGELIGINSFIDTQNSSMNFAVSLTEVERFLKAKGSKLLPVKTQLDCKPNYGEEYETEDDDYGPSLNIPVDSNCDGNINLIIMVPYNESKPMLMFMDRNKDGKADVILVDEDRDYKPEYSILDTDYDGKFESKGIHTTQKMAPDRIVAINE